jgi:hypothetical protein
VKRINRFIFRPSAIKTRSKTGKAACKDAKSTSASNPVDASATQAIQSVYLQLSNPFIGAYRKDHSHAKQFFPDDKKNYKASYCTDTA